ncbi:MAG TPA: MOSC N-terminal beta barrel domain-containing protein [Trebonia sp.]|nr:MOSC N-terminal beta barrel domain-containing protein [Trebonia sp.]
MSLRLTDIWRYPVKSCRGQRLNEAHVEPWGLAGDRRWMLVDGDGRFVTGREHPRLVLVTPALEADGAIRLSTPGLPGLTVPVPEAGTAPLIRVKVWSSELDAAAASQQASGWLRKVTGMDVRLVYLDDPTRRPTSPAHSQPGDVVSFADGYPLLLTAAESLARVNEWIAAGPHAAEGPLPMTRFRPNVVVAGDGAFAEDGWRLLKIGDVTFRVAKQCGRCVFTTVDPATAVKGKEPLATLSRHRRWDGGMWFGVNLIPDEPRVGGVIAVGDIVTILA